MKPWVLFLAASAASAAGNSSMVVSSEWLAERLGDPSLVILQVGGEYAEGHVPGARLVQLTDVSLTVPGGLRLELPPVAELERAFSRFGVGEKSRVVIYAGNESVQSATRVWFTLDYLGWGGRASLLDGGLTLWKKEGRPLSKDTPAPAAGRFTAQPTPNRLATAEWVQQHLKDPAVRLLDARLPEFYSGANAGGMRRAGRIPGAHNVPYTSVFGESGKLKPVGTLREMLSVPAQFGAATYCHIGLQASVLYFVARYVGIEARLYDGSFQEWSSRPELPVEGAAAK